MTVPAFLGSNFYHEVIEGETDCANIVTAIHTTLKTTNDPAWTEPSADCFKTPVVSDRWFDVTISAPSATRLQFVVRNHLGTTIGTRELLIDAGGTDINIFSGKHHLVIQALRATPEELGVFLMDLTPEAQDAHGYTVAMFGFRNSSGATDNPGNWGEFQVRDEAGAASGRRYIYHADGLTTPRASGISINGYYIAQPVFVGAVLAVGSRNMGRCFQLVVLPDVVTPGTDVTLPLDSETTGDFTVLQFPCPGYWKYAIRKA